MQFDILKQFTNISHMISQKESARALQNSMALHTGEEKSKVIANRKRLLGQLDGADVLSTVHQVHGDTIYKIHSANGEWNQSLDGLQADAQVSDVAGVALGILTADCVPILLYADDVRAVGAVHAGWKGTRDNILAKTIVKMQEYYGVKIESMIACIGPAIGGCCYEVGEDVAKEFGGYEQCLEEKDGEKFMLDLKSINYAQLIASGFEPRQIEMSEICTSCQNNDYFSYRAEDGCSGRFMSCIALKS